MTFKSLSINVYIRILVPFIIILTFFAYQNFTQTEELIINEAFQKIENQLQMKVEELDGFIFEKQKISWGMSHNPMFINAIKQIYRDTHKRPTKAYRDFMSYLIELKNGDPEVIAVYASLDQSQRYYDSNEYVTNDKYFLNDRPVYVQEKKRQKVELANPSYDYTYKMWIISNKEPLFDENRSFLGMAGMDIKIEVIFDKINNLKVSDDSFAFAFGQDGTIFVHPDTSLILDQKIDILEDSGYENFSQIKDRFLQSEKGKEFISVNGVESVIFYSTMNSNKWKIATVVPLSKVLEPVQALKSAMIYELLIGIILISLILILVAFGIANPVKSLVGILKSPSPSLKSLTERLISCKKLYLSLSRFRSKPFAKI